jgi:hypothetical protein
MEPANLDPRWREARAKPKVDFQINNGCDANEVSVDCAADHARRF